MSNCTSDELEDSTTVTAPIVAMIMPKKSCYINASGQKETFVRQKLQHTLTKRSASINKSSTSTSAPLASLSTAMLLSDVWVGRVQEPSEGPCGEVG